MHRLLAELRGREVEDLAGVVIPDPYRSLEDGTDPRVRMWCEQQNARTDEAVRSWPHFGELRNQLASIYNRSRSLPPVRAGDLWFRTTADDFGTPARVVVAPTPVGEGRVLFDPRPSTVLWISPSPDASTLAVGVCGDGSEIADVVLLDVATGRMLPDAPKPGVLGTWTNGAQWLPDSSAFLFTGFAGPVGRFEQEIFRHTRSPRVATTREPVPWPTAKNFRLVHLALDGRYAFAVEGLSAPHPVALLDLRDAGASWRPLMADHHDALFGFALGDDYTAISYHDCDRGRVVRIDLASDARDDPDSLAELVPESDGVLVGITPVAGRIYLHELHRARSRVRILDRDGRHLADMPLPFAGAIGGSAFFNSSFAPVPDGETYVFSLSSLRTSPGLYRHDPATPERLEILAEPKFELSDLHESSDATTDGLCHQRLFKDPGAPTDPVPTLVYGYGGFNAMTLGHFDGRLALFALSGGQVILAHLPGGGELGKAWWLRGRRAHRQRCCDSLHRLAEQLIGSGSTTRDLLAVTGRSNGGLTAVLAAQQRPELWAAVVARVPWVDLIGSTRVPYTAVCLHEELADTRDERDVNRVLQLSPYHLVSERASYPAIYVDGGENDVRVPPWMPLKLAASLSAADQETLVRVWAGAGHGGADDPDASLDIHASWLAFVFMRMGMTPSSPSEEGRSSALSSRA